MTESISRLENYAMTFEGATKYELQDIADGLQAEFKGLERKKDKRIADLEQLVRDMYSVMWACRERVCVHRENNCWRVQAGGEGDGECWFEKRMEELGIDTEGGA